MSINNVYTLPIEVGYMDSIIRKWGNSQGVLIPKELLEEAGLKVDDAIKISLNRSKELVISKPKRQTIKELFKDYKGDYMFEEDDWGGPVGDEIW